MQPVRTLVLGALCASSLMLSSAFSQAPRFTTPPNTTGANSFPFNSTTNKIQLQYQAGEFGVAAPHIISHVYVQRASTGAAGSFTNLTIWMGQSSTWPTATTAFFTPVTQVYSAPTTPFPAGNVDDWVGWQLTTPFLYDPADHLIVIICQEGYTNGFSIRNLTAPTGPRRLWAAGGCAAPAPTGSGAQLYNFGFDAMPASGLHANFDADVKIGAAPLRVQFTDQTYSSDPGGVTGWAWDLNGDTRIDSTIQNPIWTYPTQGRTVSYDVTLTATDAAHPRSIMTQRNFITVDPPPKADFTATPTTGAVGPGLPPLIVRFTDLSIGATAWAWDLTGDTRVDTTVQNPVFPYVSGGRYSVTLSVTGVGGNDRITKTNFITVLAATENTLSAEILQFQFNEVRTNRVFNSASTTAAPAFGTVTNSSGPWHADAGRYGFKGNEPGFGCIRGGSLARVDTGLPTDFRGSITIQWWQRLSQPMTTTLPYFFGDGTFRCFTNGVAGLSLWFRGSSIGDVQATRDVQTGMTGRWLHVAIVVDDAAGSAAFYFDGVLDAGSLKAFAPNTFSYTGTGNFLVAGSGGSSPATTFYDIDDFRLYGNARSAAQILADMRREIGTTSPFDTGCAGTAGVPVLKGNQAPTDGLASYALNLTSAEPNIPGVLVLGAGATQFLTAPLPLSLAFLYGPAAGCNLHVSLNLAVGLVTDASGVASVPLPIPAGVAGAHVYAQGLLFGTRGAVTPGLDINIGN